jgi:Adenosine deaminase
MRFDAHVHLEAALRLARRGPGGPVGEAVLAEMVTELVTESAAHGAPGVRLRYNPMQWLRRGVGVAAQTAALTRAAADADAAGSVLSVFVSLKHGDAGSWSRAVDIALAARASGAPVDGLDVSRAYAVDDPAAAPVTSAPSGPMVERVRAAGRDGLVVAVHLGWFDRAPDVELALAMRARRIGHAVPLRDDDRWDAALAGAGAVVEVCPTAYRRRTGLPLDTLPVDRWLDAGIAVEAGTDHPLAFGTTFDAEWRLLTAAFPRLATPPGRGCAAGPAPYPPCVPA